MAGIAHEGELQCRQPCNGQPFHTGVDKRKDQIGEQHQGDAEQDAFLARAIWYRSQVSVLFTPLFAFEKIGEIVGHLRHHEVSTPIRLRQPKGCFRAA